LDLNLVAVLAVVEIPRATSERNSPCNSDFTSPRSTGPFADPFPLPVMIWTIAPVVRLRHEFRKERTAEGTGFWVAQATTTVGLVFGVAKLLQ